MNNIRFRAYLTATSLIASAVVAPPATAQRAVARNPIFVVVPFRSRGEPKLGVDIAEAVRDRMTHYFQQKPIRPGALRIVTREDVNNYLSTSGFSADSAMSTNELKDLGRAIGADESMEGTATRTAAGVEVRARFYSLNNIQAAEVLPVIIEKNADNAGRSVADAYNKARKEIPEYQKCRAGLIGNDLDAAIAGGRKALLEYDKGVLPRACLMTAYFKLYQTKKMPIDSTIKVAQEIMAIDPDNEIAIGQLADAYSASGDAAKALEMNLKLYRLNPTNVSYINNAIQGLANSGAPEQAIPIVKDVIANNPGDPNYQDTYWKLLQAAKQWKPAIAAGEELVKLDTARADTSYFNRQIAAAIADSQPALELQYLSKATVKYPTNTRYWMGLSQELRKQGQLQASLDAARHALAIDPKLEGINPTILRLYAALGQADSAMAFARTAMAAGVDKATVGTSLLPLVKPAMTKAQASDARSDWEEVNRVAATIDSLAPTPETAFYMSVASFTVGMKAVAGVADLAKTDKAKACADNKVAGDMFLVVDLNMARGGRVDPATAAKLLTTLAQYKPYVDQYKKAIPCK